jgi:hypothetical protein
VRYYDAEFTFTQTKVEGIVLKAAWNWGNNSSVLNNPLGEPNRTPSVRVGLSGG